MDYPTRAFASIIVVAFLSGSLAAQGPRQPQEGSKIQVDYAATRREIRSFEVILANVIKATFSSSPFALVQEPKGVYLQGYGVTVTFLINIHRAVLRTPFGDVRQGVEVTPELKKRRIAELKDKLIKVLLDDGDSLRQLRKEDFVTVVAFIEDTNFPDEPNENKTLVLSVLKKDLDELARKDDRRAEFIQRMRIVEY
ncbi:MAG TPA: hypothetical protein VE398_08440 [Acidobacteriota bacterium]|nr:hypothetical protein [Acidobacteriota bacterium]